MNANTQFVQKIIAKYNKRNHYYDILKLVAIVFVCISHINFLSDGFYYGFNNIVFLLELPLFFFVTGLLQYRSKRYERFTDYIFVILRRLVCYLVPYITFHFFRVVIYNDYSHFFNRIYDNICYPFNGLWFLLAIALITLVLETSKYLLNKKKIYSEYYYPIILPVVMGLLWAVFSKINILPFTAYFRLSLYYSIYILFGYYLFLLINIFQNKKKLLRNTWIVSFIVSLMVFNFIVFYFKSIYKFDDTNLLLILARILGSISGIVIVSTLFFFLIRYKAVQYISFGGIFTLQIYYLHILLQFLIPSMGELNAIAQLGVTVMWNVIFVVGSIVVVHILYFVPYANFVVFGTHYSGYVFEKEILSRKKQFKTGAIS